MATDFDLAERANVPVDVVRAWLKQRGYGGKRGQRIKPMVERAFLEAHQGAEPSMASWSSAPAPPPPAPRAKPAPVAPPRPNVVVRDQARRIADLQRELSEARAALAVAQAERARPTPAPEPVTRPAPAPTAVSVRTLLARQGLQGQRAVEAFGLALAQQPERLLTALSTDDEALFARVQPVCAVVACRTVATFNGWHPVAAGAQDCAVCRGSDNRRWFRLMAARLKRARCERVLIVGGGPGSHADLRRLLRDADHLDVQIVDGEKSLDARRAKALVNGVDVVAFWASTILPHSVSDMIKDAARSAPRLIRAVTPNGGRGVARLCQSIIEALDQQRAARR